MEYAKICDIGKVRKVNQDRVLAVSKKDMGLFVIADGMGGYSEGEKASQKIIEKMERWWEKFCFKQCKSDFSQNVLQLEQELLHVNREIYLKYNKGKICGSTIALLFICKNVYAVISAGDSRAYVYSRRKLVQLTMDEVWENQQCLTEQERKKDWDRQHGKLYNAVGIRERMQYRVSVHEWNHGMVFLLCSDGLYKYCSELYLKKCLKKAKREKDMQICAVSLLKEVYQREAEDNVSIIIIKV